MAAGASISAIFPPNPAASRRLASDPLEIVRRQTLPGYRLVIERSLSGAERLNFTSIPVDPLAAAVRRRALATSSGENL
jgi:hypothetical protein